MDNHKLKKIQSKWQKAETHGQSCKTRQNKIDSQGKVCQCCFRSIENQPISLCVNSKQLEFLGFGIPIYYIFIHSCILLLLTSIFSFSVMQLYRNYSYNDGICSSNPSSTDIHHGYSVMRHFMEQGEHGEHGHHEPLACSKIMIKVASTQKNVDDFELLLRGCSFALHLIMLVYIRNKQNRLYNYYDEKTCSLSDYTVIMRRIPEEEGNKQKIKEYFGNYCDPQTLQDIILIPNQDKLDQLQKEMEKLEEEYEQESKKDEASKDLESLESQLEKIEHEMEAEIQQMKQQLREDKLTAERALVIFNREHQKNEFLQAFEKSKGEHGWSNIKIGEAAEPSEIIWENSGVSHKEFRIRNILSYIFSLLLLTVVTVVFAIVIRYKTVKVEELIQENNKEETIEMAVAIGILVYGTLFAVILFNKLIMVKIFHKFTDMERKLFSHQFQFSFCLKYCLGLFFTTAIMTLIVEDFMFNNFYAHPYGVIEMETIMFILNSTFVPIFWAINPYYLAKLIKRYLNRNKKAYISQEQANEIMKDPSYEVGKRYAQILEVMWFTYLYYTLIPIGAIFSCLGLFFYYWVDKYNLLRKSSMEIKVSGRLANMTLNLLDLTLFWRTASELLYDYQIKDKIHVVSWVMFAISMIYILLPSNRVINLVMGEHFQPEEKEYRKVKNMFKINYYTNHILYSKLPADKAQLAREYQLKLVQSLVDQNIVFLAENKK